MIFLYEYEIEKRKGLLLQVDRGWGEIAPLNGFSQESFDEAKKELLTNLPRLFAFEPKCPSVQFGISQSRTPFCTQPISLPLAALHTPFEGAQTLKLKLGPLSIEKARALVQNYLPQIRLRLDFNRMWPIQKVKTFLSFFSSQDFEYLEEPAPNLQELIDFSKTTDFPIALDESLQEKGWNLVEKKKALIHKPTLLGPYFSSKEMVILSSSYESSIGILQIAKMAGPTKTAVGLDTFKDDLLEPPLKKEGGNLIWSENGSFPIRKERLCLIAHVP